MRYVGFGTVFTLILIGAVFFTLSVGCGGSGLVCTSVTYKGQRFEGTAKTLDEAKSNACNKYCREADPEYDARYRIWLDSPKGKAAGSPSKQEAIFKDNDLMTFVTETCSKKCVDAGMPNLYCEGP